jgi:pyruvate dehydrogenase E2 component (dihydrolipoamide acetyltransferase)
MANTVEMPKLGFDMTEGKLVKWVKGENEKIEKGDVLAEIETDKATVEVESPFGGVVAKHLVSENSFIPVGSPIAVITAEGETFDQNTLPANIIESTDAMAANQPSIKEKETSQVGSQAISEVEAKGSADERKTNSMLKASPLAKRIAREKGIDLTTISGSGPGERIVKRDLEKAQLGQPAAGLQPKPKPDTAVSIPRAKDEVIEISRLRAAIGKRMLESHQSIPYFTVTHSYNAEALITLRKELNEGAAEEAKISINDFFIRAVSLALADFPNLNASISGSQITRHGVTNIGVAVAVENGLLTIVVKDANQKTLPEVSREMKEMAARVRDGKVRNDDIEGSTFTISNLGMFEVEDFTAIINPPEAAILAIGSTMQVPVVINGSLSVGWRVKATLTADHRITDGAEAARFMQHLALFLEQPWRLL